MIKHYTNVQLLCCNSVFCCCYFACGKGTKYCNHCLCLSVSPSVSFHMRKTACPNFIKFSAKLLAYYYHQFLLSPLITKKCVMWMTSCFLTVGDITTRQVLCAGLGHNMVQNCRVVCLFAFLHLWIVHVGAKSAHVSCLVFSFVLGTNYYQNCGGSSYRNFSHTVENIPL